METQAIAALDAWLAESFRCTAFIAGGDLVSLSQDWWSQVATETDVVVNQPKLGTIRFEAKSHSEHLVLTARPSRADWTVEAPKAEAAEVSPVLGKPSEVIPSFEERMEGWLRQLARVERLAFGASLLQFVDSREAGQERLAEYLHAVEVDAANSSDLLYQINRPVPSGSGLPGLKVNRLSRWQVQSATLISIPGTGGARPESTTQSHACKLELDVNTAPRSEEELPAERLVEIFAELIRLGEAIAIQGDK